MRSIDRLRQPIANAIRRFEDLSAAYERKLSEEGAKGVGDARWEYLNALGDLLRMMINTSPSGQRADYESMLLSALADYRQYHERPGATIFSQVAPATLPLEIALGMKNRSESETRAETTD